jgi:hypothetical protein
VTLPGPRGTAALVPKSNTQRSTLPMPDRDWSKELAKIDRRLESASDEALFPEPRNATPAARAQTVEVRTKTRAFGAVLRLLLATALGVAMLFWPYDARCGIGLAAYLGATGVLIVAGVWSSVWTWRHRTGRAHTLSLLIILWGLVLGSIEVLPRVGYAKPTLGRPAMWMCG